MNIFLGVTLNFIHHAVETVYSIRLASKDYLNVFLFVDESDINTIEHDLNSLGIPNTQFILISNKEFDNIFKNENTQITSWPRVVFSRPFMLKYFADRFDRILFIDADAFVIRPGIDDLYAMDFNGKYAIAVEDLPVSFFDHDEMQNIQVEKYFNMGCVLINLEKIKNDGLTDICLKILSDPSYKEFVFSFHYGDQSLMNFLFKNNVKFVDPKYNVQSIMFAFQQYDTIAQTYGYSDQIELINSCVVFHNTGKAKPWDKQAFQTWQPFQLPFRAWHYDWYCQLVNNLQNQHPLYKKLVYF